MNRLLAILVTLFILFLVYLWINHLMGSSPKEKLAEETPTMISDDQQYEEPQGVQTIPDYDVPAQEEPQETEQVTEAEPDENEYNVTPATPKKEEPKPEPEKKTVEKAVEPPAKKTTTPPAVTAPSTGKDSGAHLVIAGNFSSRANAEERVKELKKLGYAKAEVVNFELSEYHTACAGRYSDMNEARRVAKKIKDSHNIDTYVRHGN